MKWRIHLSPAARRDIEQVLGWTLANFGPGKHDEYVELIRLALEAIAVNPKDLHSRARTELHRDARIYHIARRGKKARHFFVYRIRKSGTIEIGRFLYDGMDIIRHLPEGFATDEMSDDDAST